MALTKHRIGDLISVVDERNTYGIHDFFGININKEFMPTVANTEGLDETKYKVIRKNRFVFSGMQTGRDECIRISMYEKEKPIIVSPAYTTFEVTSTDIVLPMYFFMCFLSHEKDRLGWFLSDGSIRSNLDWEVFCDIELNLPPISVQQIFVNIYTAMIANQQSYERGLEDLKLTVDALLDKYKKSARKVNMADLLEEVDVRNTKNQFEYACGVNITKQFMPSVASSSDLHNYKIVSKNQFVFSGMQTGRDECIRIALLTDDTPLIVSPAYTVFKVKCNDVIPEYIQMWFSRSETDRFGWFLSDASIRTNLDLECFYGIEIPLPDYSSQLAIVNIYKAYTNRRKINEQLKEQIKNICSILIKGSLVEGK